MTLVSIIGDFHSSVLPLFYEFQESIKTHIIVYDDARSDTLKAHKIYKGTKHYIKQKKLPIQTQLLKIDEDSQHDLEAIKNAILSMKDEDSELLVNATDGLASIALYLAYKLLDKDVKFVSYDRFDNSYNLLDKGKMSFHSLTKCMSIQEHFMLKDIQILSEQNLQQAKEIKQEVLNLFEGCNGDRELYREYFSNDDKISNIQTGFLYEAYIYNLIKELNFDDIAMGVKIVDSYSPTNEINNEFDILIMKENHLHMIECKFIDPLENKAELVYKLDSVRQTLDEDSRLMLLSNEVFYNQEKENPYFTPSSVYKRSHNKKIYLRGSPVEKPEQFIKELDILFGLNTPEIENILQNRLHAIKKVKKNRVVNISEINRYLRSKLQFDIDFTDKKELLKVLNYNMNYPHHMAVRKAFQDEQIKRLIQLLNKVDSFEKGSRLEELLSYFYENFQIKGVS